MIHKQEEPTMAIEPKHTHLFSRQPPSTLSKIAFGTFLIGALSGIGGTVAITLSSGAPSRDIVTLMIGELLCTILIATRVRWMQVIALPISAYLFYLVLTEPFVLESLTNPKGPHGGLGAFIGEMFIIANSIIAFIATFGIILQDYRGGSRKAPRWLPSVLCGVIGLVIGASYIGGLAQPYSIPTLTYTNGVPTLHVSAGNFDLSSVTIPKGSKLLLVAALNSHHVLANGTWQQNTPLLKQEQGAPLINDLSLDGNKVTIGPFAVAGTYHILCLIHHGMNLTITVQ
ncbi:MAG: hypothetical protein H0V70_07245 [Ktedonobacteraceae bacterium]|nr:hypothetical protein [Ktedonobacteraceae bacterium]